MIVISELEASFKIQSFSCTFIKTLFTTIIVARKKVSTLYNIKLVPFCKQYATVKVTNNRFVQINFV